MSDTTSRPALTSPLPDPAISPTVETMRGIGNALGQALAHAEDVLALSGRRTRPDATLTAMVATRTSAICDVTGTAPDLVAGRLEDPEFRTLALLESQRACTGALEHARGDDRRPWCDGAADTGRVRHGDRGSGSGGRVSVTGPRTRPGGRRDGRASLAPGTAVSWAGAPGTAPPAGRWAGSASRCSAGR